MTFWLELFAGGALVFAILINLWARKQDDSEPDYDGWWSDD